MTGAPIGEISFLRKLQRLLAEGDFVATYKFALLKALADLCLEREPAAGERSRAIAWWAYDNLKVREGVSPATPHDPPRHIRRNCADSS